MDFALIQLNQCSQEILCKLIGATQTTCVFLSSFSILLIAVSILRYIPSSPFICPILTKENAMLTKERLKKDKSMHIVAFDFNLQVDRYLVIVHPNIAKISKIQVETS